MVGIDEVGRGCWAGPLVAGAVILPTKLEIDDASVRLRDSKQLSRKQREATAQWLYNHALAIGLGWVWPNEIDEHGLTWAVRSAMARALNEVVVDYDDVIIDGNINYLADNPRAHAIVRADSSVPAVSAASIVAKVARDTYMSELDESYDGYGFNTHVGYGTAAHIASLKALGVSDIHRRSYKPIRKFMS